MKENVKFYKCEVCENVIGLIDGDPKRITCCEKEMKRLNPNTADAAQEKHVPVYEKIGDEILVKVGEVGHPMGEDHYIMWIAQVTDNTTTRVRLKPEESPEAKFTYVPGAVLYAYCNKHGLWKTIVE